MRDLIASTAQFIAGIAIFYIGALLLTLIPRLWSNLNGLPPDVFNAEWAFPFWALYAMVSLAFLGGGIALMFSDR